MSENNFEDFRESNPGLHRLYVIWAQEKLQRWNDFLQDLEESSQVDDGILAGKIWAFKRECILGSAAYQEACWRIEAHDLLSPKDFSEDDGLVSQYLNGSLS